MSDVNPSSRPETGNVAPASDEEVVFYSGFPRLRGELLLIAQCLVPGLLLILVPFLWAHFGYGMWYEVWRIAGGWLTAVGFILVGVLAVALPLLLVKRNRYKISNYRIDLESGLLFKTHDTIELWHVDDVQMKQSPIDRVLRVGTIMIKSGDRTTPFLKLRSLPEPRKLFDAIKQRVIAVKRQRGVLKIDTAGG